MDNYKEFNYLEYHICDHCNLNCVGCFHNAPLVKEPVFRTVESFKSDLKQIKKFIPNNTPIGLDLLGGEPLLHPEILDFIKVAKNIIPVTEIITNGILLPKMSQEFFDIINNYNINIKWSKYFESEEIQAILETKVNNYQILNAKFLLNKGYNFTANYNSQEINEIYIHCGNPAQHANCYTLRDGFLYKCAWEAWADYLLNYFDIEPYNYNRDKNRLNIYKVNSLEDIQIFLNTPSEFCNFCIDTIKMGSQVTKWRPSKLEITEWVKK